MSRPVQAASQSVMGRLLGGMRFPQLFLLFGLLFVADLFVPDFIPFIDEIILGVLTMMTALWQKDRGRAEAPGAKPSEKNITPDR